MIDRDPVFEDECAEYLRAHGYKVTRASAAPRKARKLTGKRHEGCSDHERVDGYTSSVCILSGQDGSEVLSFARECLAIGAAAGDVLDARHRMARYASKEEVAVAA